MRRRHSRGTITARERECHWNATSKTSQAQILGKFPRLTFSCVEILQVVSAFPFIATDFPLPPLSPPQLTFKTSKWRRASETGRVGSPTTNLLVSFSFCFLFFFSFFFSPLVCADRFLLRSQVRLSQRLPSLANMSGELVIIFQVVAAAMAASAASPLCVCPLFFLL